MHGPPLELPPASDDDGAALEDVPASEDDPAEEETCPAEEAEALPEPLAPLVATWLVELPAAELAGAEDDTTDVDDDAAWEVPAWEEDPALLPAVELACAEDARPDEDAITLEPPPVDEDDEDEDEVDPPSGGSVHAAKDSRDSTTLRTTERMDTPGVNGQPTGAYGHRAPVQHKN